MTDVNHEGWLVELLQKAAQYSIIFVQLGARHAAVRTSMEGSTLSRIQANVFAKGSSSTPQSVSGEKIIVLDGLDELRKRKGELLGGLRDAVMTMAADGYSFILLSRSPKTAYPDTRGSDVIADAKQVFAPHAFVDVGDPDSTVRDALAVRELGDRTVMAVSEALWEKQQSPRDLAADLPRADLAALRGASIVVSEGDPAVWSPDFDHRKLKRVFSLVASEAIIAEHWVSDVYQELWLLERMIRNALRVELMAKQGEGWRSTCLSAALMGDVLQRAQVESYPQAIGIQELRDPLEWLTTSELFQLREDRELGPLGLQPASLWNKLRNEILPVRNQVAHMRLIAEKDAFVVARWRKILGQRLRGANGFPS